MRVKYGLTILLSLFFGSPNRGYYQKNVLPSFNRHGHPLLLNAQTLILEIYTGHSRLGRGSPRLSKSLLLRLLVSVALPSAYRRPSALRRLLTTG